MFKFNRAMKVRRLSPEEKSDIRRLPAKLRAIDMDLEETVQAVERGDLDPTDLELEEEFGPATPDPRAPVS